jgi:hypothetical protein
MTNRLLTSAAILAFVCSTSLLSPAYAQDEGTGEDTGGELVDPMPDEGSGDGGDVVINDGEVVPYGPEDCIDCNVAPTMVDVGDRPEGENYRSDVLNNEAFSRAGSDDSDEICDPTKMGKAATICN